MRRGYQKRRRRTAFYSLPVVPYASRQTRAEKRVRGTTGSAAQVVPVAAGGNGTGHAQVAGGSGTEHVGQDLYNVDDDGNALHCDSDDGAAYITKDANDTSDITEVVAGRTVPHIHEEEEFDDDVEADAAVANIAHAVEDAAGSGTADIDALYVNDAVEEEVGGNEQRRKRSVKQYLGKGHGLLGLKAEALWSLLKTQGSQQMTDVQYRSVVRLSSTMGTSCDARIRMLVDSYALAPRQKKDLLTALTDVLVSTHRLPNMNTVHSTILPVILRKLAVRASLINAPFDASKAGAKADGCVDGTRCLEYVSPLDYAVADVANPVFFSELRCGGRAIQRAASMDLRGCAEDAPIVAARSWFYGAPQAFEDDSSADGTPITYAEAGDVVAVQLIPQAATRITHTVWYDSAVGPDCCVGVVVGVVEVHHANDSSVRSPSQRAPRPLTAALAELAE